MSFNRGVLSEEQKRRINENRKRAQDRLNKKNGVSSLPTASVSTSTSTPAAKTRPTTSTDNSATNTSNPQVINGSTIKITASYEHERKRPRIELSDEQKKQIQENRNKALEIQLKLKNKGVTAPTPEAPKPLESNVRSQASSVIEIGNSVRLNNNRVPDPEPKFSFPPIKRADYIEYDFATMEDTRGGFIGSEHTEDGDQLKPSEPVFVKESAAPIDVENAPKCVECGSIELDQNIFKNFNQVRVCRNCVREKPDKYSLLTKTECKEDYLLTDPELRDEELLPRIEKPNPHGFSRMLLFLRCQVEEYAWKKWGSSDGLDKEWERREAMKIKRRDKKYNDQLIEMRRKTRAEEYTRKLRNGVGLGERHVHDWSIPLSVPGEDNMIKKRCVDCGVETEEYIILT